MANTTTNWATKSGAQRAFQTFLGSTPDGCNLDSEIHTDGNRWYVKAVFTTDVAEKFPEVVSTAKERFGNVGFLNGKVSAPVPAPKEPAKLEVLSEKPVEKSVPVPAAPKARKVKSGVAGTSTATPRFRPGSKRELSYNLLSRPQGATVEDGKKALDWAKEVVIGQYYETATLVGRKLSYAINPKGEKVYRLT